MASSMYECAIAYANIGLAVFPLTYKGKIPLTKNGCKEATTDAAKIKAWWQTWPDANIGIATGKVSGGLFVIDVDNGGEKSGLQSIQAWEKVNGALSESWMAKTGGNGYHVFYRSEKDIRNRAGILPNVDIRGEGGYVVAPPSLHGSGKRYEWLKPPTNYNLADAPEHVLRLLFDRKSAEPNFSITSTIQAGERNSTLFKLASSLQAKGLSDAAILAAVQVENQEKCNPPLGDKEVQLICNSVQKHYEKGNTFELQNTKREANEVCKSELKYIETRTGERIAQTIENARIIIEGDSELTGKIFYNELSRSPWVKGRLPWDSRKNNREWTNADDSNLRSYIENKWDIKAMDRVSDALIIVGDKHKFNPVTDFLEGLEWDGVKRIENLLPDYLGVEKNEYSIESMKIFMMGAIERAYHPGAKFDYTPILTGAQGCGKSTFWKTLSCNPEWFNDNFNTIEGDKAPERLRGMWIVNMDELLAVKRTQSVESLKSFLTTTIDNYRAPYQKRTESRPRRCVFCGTTNSDHFLTDRTGNRRYLPLRVDPNKKTKSLFTDNVTYEFQQAWAEAMVIYKSGDYSLVFPEELQEEVEKQQKTYVEEDVRIGIIQEWLDKHFEDKVCVAQIFKEALGNEFVKPSRKESNEIHDIMLHEIRGWERLSGKTDRARIGEYGTQICYQRITKEFEELSENTPFD